MAARRASLPALYAAGARPELSRPVRIAAFAALSLALVASTLFAHTIKPSNRLAAAGIVVAQDSPRVRISQVYGGGSDDLDDGALPDFVELFNAGPDAVSLTGWI